MRVPITIEAVRAATSGPSRLSPLRPARLQTPGRPAVADLDGHVTLLRVPCTSLECLRLHRLAETVTCVWDAHVVDTARPGTTGLGRTLLLPVDVVPPTWPASDRLVHWVGPDGRQRLTLTWFDGLPETDPGHVRRLTDVVLAAEEYWRSHPDRVAAQNGPAVAPGAFGDAVATVTVRTLRLLTTASAALGLLAVADRAASAAEPAPWAAPGVRGRVDHNTESAAAVRARITALIARAGRDLDFTRLTDRQRRVAAAAPALLTPLAPAVTAALAGYSTTDHTETGPVACRHPSPMEHHEAAALDRFLLAAAPWDPLGPWQALLAALSLPGPDRVPA